jgi:hypothetical protein
MDTVAEMLMRAEGAGLEVISITDHDGVGAYYDLEDKATRSLFSGKIITGVEICAVCNGVCIEILAYGIDYKKMDKLIKRIPSDMFHNYVAKKLIEKLEKLGQLGIKMPSYNPDTVRWFDFYEHLVKEHKDFLDSLDEDFAKNVVYFYRQGLNNKNCILSVSYDDFLMQVEKVLKNIRECGGLAFLAHPAEYGGQAEEILEYLKDKVDGIEVYHSTANAEYKKTLLEFCKDNNLLVSGGSDYHGPHIKPDVKIGVGKGDLKIKRKDVSWVDGQAGC